MPIVWRWGHPLATAEAYKGYGIALFEAGRLIEARGMFQSALQGADTGDLYLVLGALECALGERGAAVEQLEECVKRWPSNSDAWVLLWRAGDDSDRAALEPRARRWCARGGPYAPSRRRSPSIFQRQHSFYGERGRRVRRSADDELVVLTRLNPGGNTEGDVDDQLVHHDGLALPQLERGKVGGPGRLRPPT